MSTGLFINWALFMQQVEYEYIDISKQDKLSTGSFINWALFIQRVWYEYIVTSKQNKQNKHRNRSETIDNKESESE